MPHVSIKLIGNPTSDEKARVAKRIVKVLEEELGKPEKYISISLEGFSFGDWEKVYNEEIKDNKHLILKPGYKNPKTFE